MLLRAIFDLLVTEVFKCEYVDFTVIDTAILHLDYYLETSVPL